MDIYIYTDDNLFTEFTEDELIAVLSILQAIMAYYFTYN